MIRQDPATTLPWMRAGQSLVERIVADLSDDALRAPSGLSGWSAAHVVGHLARNAEALGRLVAWARTGVETPMYADREQRATDIEESATRPARVLREELTTTAEALDDALAALDANAWRAEVRSALGRPLPAAEIPWMRVREVWLHAVDLGAPVDRTGLRPGDLVFFDRLRHNGIYIGGGKFIHASSGEGRVSISRLDGDWFRHRWTGGRRINAPHLTNPASPLP